ISRLLIAGATPISPSESKIRKYGNDVEACVACGASLGFAHHACQCCESWNPQYCKTPS
ncbi:uncharacterized protein SETTUDRAFT_109237, partial [Exserohilum turcica Et28A]